MRETGEVLFNWFVAPLIILVMAVGGAWCLVLLASGMSTQRRCLAAGYPDHRVTVAFEFYCVKRVAQTDVVVPLAAAEGRR